MKSSIVKRMHTVVIPCHRRADFLALTLEKIMQADGWEMQYYHFALDEGYSPEVMNVVCTFLSVATGGFRAHEVRRSQGNAYNILEALNLARHAAKPEEIIYLIEDDIWVARDFFTFHERAHREFPGVFAVVGCWNQYDRRANYPEVPEMVYYHERYEGLGVSFKASQLGLITVHDTPLYYNDMGGYLKTVFPESRYRNHFVEQDGLIQRVTEKYKLPILYPYAPRACHVGFCSNVRPGRPLEGTLEERIEQLRRMTPQEMNQRTSIKNIRFCRFEGYLDTPLELNTARP